MAKATSTKATEATPMHCAPPGYYGATLLPMQKHRQRPGSFVWYCLTSPLQPFTWQLVVFHTLHLLLATLSFPLVLAGAVASVALVPLCCLGLVVAKILVRLVSYLTQLDVYLHNCATRRGSDCLLLGEDLDPYCRDSNRLATVSRASMYLTGYYMLLKPPLALVGSFGVLGLFGLSLATIAAPFLPSLNAQGILLVGPPAGAGLPMVLLGLLRLYVAIFLLHVSASGINATTKLVSSTYHDATALSCGKTHDLPRGLIQGQQTMYYSTVL
ncbi:hypothetical protein SPRG_04042 [Saprolegnia parasitica CBS 223.65]|uniref:Sensor domain-containing protein n=1 Tax=Saprolegnia parasitica (strain CBS 223.65) TaxID=695850 RepID=A0A067CX96_SAPPC|nr:hypothetical protein SPRG_04042 [Saprolegnia parasitica CBS 223.65]KDO31427.1 hypothetical protein SPRG_04042 [Saprolegnia parasitica CBS 223.65]|eukprot:XP_012198022.1 hypothetical protein SPRG_04042 [Saprolegnia parasitica CBS 223.65]